MEEGKKLEILRKRMTSFSKLMGTVPLSVIVVFSLWVWIANRFNSDFVPLLLPISYLILAMILGYFFSRTIHIFFVILIATFFVFISFIFLIPNKLGPILAFNYTPLSVPVAIVGCFIGKLIHDMRNKNEKK